MATRIWKIARNVILILGALLAVFFLFVVPWFFSRIVTSRRFHFPDPNDGKTPGSYGLHFRWIDLHSSDGILLKGWYIPAAGDARGTIVYCHGLNRTRLEMLPEAVFAHGLGYNSILFDFRHHGQSGGNITTLGYYERLDVEAAVRYALAEPWHPSADGYRAEQKAACPIVLWGVSMGAAAALLAAADSPEVTAVVSDSSFLSFSDTVRHHLKLFLHLPSFPIAEEVIYWSAWRGKFRASDFDLVKAVERIGTRPILFVALQDDRRMPPSIARTLYAHAASPHRELVILPGKRHGEGFKQATELYQKAVHDFLASVMNQKSVGEATR
jgi:pimeloyl-ACP methyl ester carboxylesterase